MFWFQFSRFRNLFYKRMSKFSSTSKNSMVTKWLTFPSLFLLLLTTMSLFPELFSFVPKVAPFSNNTNTGHVLHGGPIAVNGVPDAFYFGRLYQKAKLNHCLQREKIAPVNSSVLLQAEYCQKLLQKVEQYIHFPVGARNMTFADLDLLKVYAKKPAWLHLFPRSALS